MRWCRRGYRVRDRHVDGRRWWRDRYANPRKSVKAAIGAIAIAPVPVAVIGAITVAPATIAMSVPPAVTVAIDAVVAVTVPAMPPAPASTIVLSQ